MKASVAARLLVETITRGGASRSCSSLNMRCAGFDSTRYGVCSSTRCSEDTIRSRSSRDDTPERSVSA